jgi:tRNA-dihydrouridine synthase B
MTWYAKNFPGAAELRGQLAVIETVSQGLELIDRAIERLKNDDLLPSSLSLAIK